MEPLRSQKDLLDIRDRMVCQRLWHLGSDTVGNVLLKMLAQFAEHQRRGDKNMGWTTSPFGRAAIPDLISKRRGTGFVSSDRVEAIANSHLSRVLLRLDQEFAKQFGYA